MSRTPAALILTHGAGSNADAPLLITIADSLSERGLLCVRYTLPFRQLRPLGPPRAGDAQRDRQGLKQQVLAMRERTQGPVILGGHSYGGRQATMLAAEEPQLADGLFLLSYPLHPPRRPEELRTAHFPALRTPALFLHGSRDAFGTLDEMRAAVKLIPGCTELVAVEGAGHDLKSKSSVSIIVEAFGRFFGSDKS